MQPNAEWHVAYEDAWPLWIHDLDADIYGTHHRRLCVWQDEADESWCWEIETYTDQGMLASGTAVDREAAMKAAIERAAEILS